MIFDWRPSFVRGGSGWLQAGLVSISVGVMTSATLDVPPTFTYVATSQVAGLYTATCQQTQTDVATSQTAGTYIAEWD